MLIRPAFLALLAAGTLAAQELPSGRDFLTDYEVDVLREKQAVRDRITTYIKFASLRLELIDQFTKTEEAGTGAKVHRNLEEYSSIIAAIDTVIDDALARNRPIENALEGLLTAEERFEVRLTALQEHEADDAWRYEFALEDAIAITQDSMELLAEDLGDRKREVLVQDKRDERRQLESMTPERRKEVEKERSDRSAAATERETKRPSLLRPGEKLGGDK